MDFALDFVLEHLDQVSLMDLAIETNERLTEAGESDSPDMAQLAALLEKLNTKLL